MESAPQLTRHAITLVGVVQGVGMRPHVAAVAAKHGVSGWCGNTASAVFIEAQGNVQALEAFRAELLSTLPALAHVDRAEVRPLPVRAGEQTFRIVASHASSGERTLIPPDVAPCAECMAEFYDPANRRFSYPFITCTNCGPRLSIIESLPYDRPNTTMKRFPLCPACQAEYTDPKNRRFHAQPISCPDCGPSLWFESAASGVDAATVARHDDAYASFLAATRRAFDAGQILAVRGIGGFHLMCDAMNAFAIARLRERKRRPHKPLAVMVPDLAAAEELVVLDDAQRELLTSPARPIVVAPSRGVLPAAIAPGLRDVGVVIAYSPMHALIVDRPLVATSGNPPGEPLVTDVDAARELLGDYCDGFVMHDRGIASPVEDSVAIGAQILRRSRGMAPLPVNIGAGADVFAVGGEIKNTACLTSGPWAHISPHIGDMASWRAQQRLDSVFSHLTALRDAPPAAIICDLHPGYSTTAWAERRAELLDVPLIQVQHHEAHAASVLADCGLVSADGLDSPAVVIAADGTGYGSDGTIWGGEIFAVDRDLSFTRRWHVPTFPLVGGDRAVTQPWRAALGLAARWQLDAAESGGTHGGIREVTRLERLRHVLAEHAGEELALVDSQLDSNSFAVECSSLGRLFDAAATLLGCADDGRAVTYESQAAMLVEHLARRAGLSRDGDWNRGTEPTAGLAQAVSALCTEDVPPEVAARRFHDRVAAVLAQQALAAARDIGARTIAATGGCAFNQLLIADLRHHLGAAGYELTTHQRVPAGDGGLSLGQAVIGRRRLAAGQF